ncbi:hypothetical protein K3495_g9797 [Podosphaera aphanis]|nr:hypothetical protein K3495_g9797 [Podosphaera aphanis]
MYKTIKLPASESMHAVCLAGKLKESLPGKPENRTSIINQPSARWEMQVVIVLLSNIVADLT